MSEENISALFVSFRHKAPFRATVTACHQKWKWPPFFSLTLCSSQKAGAQAQLKPQIPAYQFSHCQLFLQVCDHLCPTHTHTDIFVSNCRGVSTERTWKTEGNIARNRQEMWARWFHYGSRLMRVSVRDIAAGGHTMKSPHNCSLHSFFKATIHRSKQVMIMIYGNTEQRGQFQWQMQKYLFQISMKVN